MKSDIIEKIYEENLIEYIDRVNMTDRDKEIVQIYLSEKTTYRELGERIRHQSRTDPTASYKVCQEKVL